MEEQRIVMEQLNDFLKRRGLRANHVAKQIGIRERAFYCFKSGSRLLTKTQLRKLQEYMSDYERRMNESFGEGGKKQDETSV